LAHLVEKAGIVFINRIKWGKIQILKPNFLKVDHIYEKKILYFSALTAGCFVAKFQISGIDFQKFKNSGV
jgi:uncharacterized membrane protein